MPFDTITMAAVTDELQAVVGGQIQRIIQPSEASVALCIYAGGQRRWLVLSADPRYARVSLAADRLAKAFPSPSAFIMLLRKYLEGVRIAGIEQLPWERVLRLTGGSGEYEAWLIAEVMGRHSNVMLVNPEHRILGALKVVPPRQSRVRPIRPGDTYRPPPARERDPAVFSPGPRIDPIRFGTDLRATLLQSAVGTTIRDALLGILPGSSPFLVDQIALRAEVDWAELVRDVDVDRLLTAITEIYRLYDSHQWQPCLFTDRRGRLDFAPYLPLNVRDVEPVDTVSTAVDRAFGSVESRDALASARKDILTQVDHARRAAARRSASLREGLAAAAAADEAKERGQLILAYQHAVRPGDPTLTIPELDVTLPLDPALSARENAERTFRRYQKLRDAGRRIPQILQESEAEEARLDDLAVFVGLADSEGTLRDLQREVQVRPDGPATEKAAQSRRRGPLRFQRNGFQVLVGRNARENEELTFRIARRDDLWLHARERTGAHVILQGAAPPDDILLAAGALAAHFSEGRADTAVDVDAVEVRAVRKIPGGPPGRVTYRGARTYRVAPGVDGWETMNTKAERR